MKRLALIALLCASCCYPERRETPVQRLGLPPECEGYAVVLRTEGDATTVTLRTPDHRAPSIAFWRGMMSGSSVLVDSGDPRLVSCGEGCLEAAGELRGDVCAEALWRARWQWRPAQR